MSSDTTVQSVPAHIDRGHRERPLTIAQKETAKRLGMSEKEYSEAAQAQMERGKLKREDIP